MINLILFILDGFSSLSGTGLGANSFQTSTTTNPTIPTVIPNSNPCFFLADLSSRTELTLSRDSGWFVIAYCEADSSITFPKSPPETCKFERNSISGIKLSFIVCIRIGSQIIKFLETDFLSNDESAFELPVRMGMNGLSIKVGSR
ncbi:hypothetical protein OGAPHI_002841 [Ogataea philodendri]|uniref:Secreted protein n=1 Tax=Ogataea philodendri TaxID=1378263 RepID=A0A9P8P8F8_9ASCO|nr:uncharacterized protein OGAPHI_002841 [Ogataea philodendri]KAH3667192.1 hypothetical protein OGAPHI_002841 [Ogataea philodendri]